MSDVHQFPVPPEFLENLQRRNHKLPPTIREDLENAVGKVELTAALEAANLSLIDDGPDHQALVDAKFAADIYARQQTRGISGTVDEVEHFKAQLREVFEAGYLEGAKRGS